MVVINLVEQKIRKIIICGYGFNPRKFLVEIVLGHGNIKKAVEEGIQGCYFLVEGMIGIVGDQAVCAGGFMIDGEFNMVAKSGEEDIKER